MSRLQSLKVVIHRRLAAAVEEIIGHLERTMTEYEEELESRHRQLLATAGRAEAEMQRADTEQLSLIKEEQLNWMPSMAQQGQEKDHPHIKEEQDDSWSSQEVSSQLHGLHEENVTTLAFIHVPGKSDSHEEKPQSSQLHHRQTEEHREAPGHSSAEHMAAEADGQQGCGGSKSHRSSVSGFTCLPGSDDKMSLSFEDSGDDCREMEPQTVFMMNKVPVHDGGRGTGNKSFSCMKCGKMFGQKHHLQTHMRCHTGEKPFSCSLCGKRFTQKGNLTQHLTVHTREKPCSCPVCGERFAQKGNLTQHMTVHTREKSLWARDGQRNAERPEVHLPQKVQLTVSHQR